VVGDVMTDVLVYVAEPLAVAGDTAAEIRIGHGGSGANTAAWLAWLGVPTHFAGRVGDDAFGREAARVLAEAGVTPHLAITADASTGMCLVLVGADGERTMLPDAGANAHLAPEDLPDALFVHDGHLHVSGYSLINPGSRAAARDAIARGQGAGMTISVDPASAAPLAAMGAAAFLDATVEVDVALVTLDEAEVLCGTREPAAAMERLLVTYREVVLKLGSEGASWRSRTSAREVACPAAAPQGPLVDTTGAGDAFAAGWLAARHRGAGPGEALRQACALAARAVTIHGGRP
jgi:sugar/nucleoside kinase (ribokinase family)